jgi:putative glutamine amidotransferase
MPILGICRGIQMLNVAAGGTLYQDVHHQLETQVYHQHRKGEPFNKLAHWIDIAPESQLARALGATRVEVNSLHHQAVKDVAPNLRVIARAPDGVIEGMEATNGHFVLAVQFHPEWLLDDDARMVRIFEEFVRASK